jgi:hypothetical protein
VCTTAHMCAQARFECDAGRSVAGCLETVDRVGRAEHRRPTELARGEPARNLGFAVGTGRCLCLSSAIGCAVEKVDLFDPFDQLLIRVASVFKQRPHGVNDEYQPVDTLVEIEDVCGRSTGPTGNARRKLC